MDLAAIDGPAIVGSERILGGKPLLVRESSMRRHHLNRIFALLSSSGCRRLHGFLASMVDDEASRPVLAPSPWCAIKVTLCSLLSLDLVNGCRS